MSTRTIKVLAVLNVLAASVLYIWFKTIPQYSGELAQIIDQASKMDINFRLEMTQSLRDGWRSTARQLDYWAKAAGAVILMNTAVFFWHLILIQADKERTKEKVSGLRRGNPDTLSSL